ncbi:MAG: flagellar biosynthesis protein FlhA, partial [Acidimicrobiia bacterium]
DAGQVIDAFGRFVIGGSIVVGLVIFLILVVIQFAVVTAGAGRVAEVGARFTLDAMPGKQMAIDADLNAGLIDEDEARRRRREVGLEADFYGAMDGASKFVKGDAVAGIVITLINLFGGFVIGVTQQGLSLGEAVERYSLLSVGDGLVSQIPALLISVASGIIVTRAATDSDVGTDLVVQLGRHVRALRVAAGALVCLGLAPGLPKPPFMAIAALLWFVSTRVAEPDAADAAAAPSAVEPSADPDRPEAIMAAMRVDPLQLELAVDLTDLVDPYQGGDLLDRVRALRRKLAMDVGLVIPPVRTRDNVELPPSTYVVRVHGVEVGRGQAPPGTALVLGPLPPGLSGTETVDPVFGLAAWWVPLAQAPQAAHAGSTVVDRSSVVTTHLAEVVRRCAGRLLGRTDVKALVDTVKATDPVVVDELTGAGVTLGDVHRVLQSLLDEGVSVRDLVRILEVVGERGRTTKDVELLTEAARGALGPAIAARHVGPDGRLATLTLEPLLEQRLGEVLRPTEQGTVLALDAEVLERLVAEVGAHLETAGAAGITPVVVCGPAIRPALRRVLALAGLGVAVLSYGELGDQLPVDDLGVIDLVQHATV